MSAPQARQPGRGTIPTPAEAAHATSSNRGIGPEKCTGAKSVIRSLEELGADTVFGLPGGAILPVYDPLYDSTFINHVLVRHEQGAGHAAEGYARSTGRVGVCMVTSGPAATNLVTALADAQMDSVPMVAITGQVGESCIGTDAFQEADISGIAIPVTKHNFLVKDASTIPQVLAEAFYIVQTGRPGAVLVDITKSAMNQETTFSWPPAIDLPGYHPVTKPHGKQIREAARLIAKAHKPVFLIGGGIINANASQDLLDLVALTDIPVTCTLMGMDAFPQSHPLNYGMAGMHGTIPAVAALQKSDLIIALGTRFDDRVTGNLEYFAPHAQVIHADIDPAEIGKNVTVDIPIVGDAHEVITALINTMKSDPSENIVGDIRAWVDYLDELRERYTIKYDKALDEEGHLSPQYVIETLSNIVGSDAIYVSGVGQHQMWSSQLIDFEEPRTWLNSGGLGTMGYAIPAAMGAQAGNPDKEVWAIDGDGCFQMTNQELATCALNNFPIKVALINNDSLGMVRQWQTLFYDERYSQTTLETHTRRIPDFVMLAEALGCAAFRVETEEDIVPTIEKARKINDRPVVIEFVVAKDAQVWPMVPAGTSNSEIMMLKGIYPLVDEDQARRDTI